MRRPFIKQKLCPAGLSHHPDTSMDSVQYITVYMTDILVSGCGAAACAQYLYGGDAPSGWHYSVDATEIWQSFRDDQMCRSGNSLAITVCVETGAEFAAACAQAALLTAYLLQKYKLPLDRAVSHAYWMEEGDPSAFLTGRWGVTWDTFLAQVNQYIREENEENENQLDTKTIQP